MEASDGSVPAVRLWRGAFDAVIFDLDGVLTTTARVHAAAWKDTFDEYLRRRAARQGEAVRPFDADADYREYVDGKPREEGVRSFLESRGIQLPDGTPADPPDRDTVWGVGNRKRDRFIALLGTWGVEADSHAAVLARDLRAAGVKTAVVSSSRNCGAILRVAGLWSLFDVVLDGNECARLGLSGKPAPDTFLEAARRLAVDPSHAVVIEDAPAGVAAGRRGGFGCVIGVDRRGQAAALRVAGAHLTVRGLSDVAVTNDGSEALRQATALPSALDHLGALLARAGARRLAVFLDYDGTLTPIVSRPEDARLSPATRRVLHDLARIVPVAIISGRDLADVRDLVGLDDVVYAGSHGFEIAGPGGARLDTGPGEAFVPALDAAEGDLRRALAAIAGAAVERKRFTVAVHYRRVPDAAVARVAAIVDAAAAAHAVLRRTEGKMVFELQPDIEWHKGAAVRYVLQLIDRAAGRRVPLYIGDDLTDEQAFRAIARDGVPVVVRDEPRPTCAHYALDDAAEVRQFLEALHAALAGEPSP